VRKALVISEDEEDLVENGMKLGKKDKDCEEFTYNKKG